MNNRPESTIVRLHMLFCLILLIASCGGARPSLSESHLSAIDFNSRAEAAFKKGDYKNSLLLYKEALRINRSIDNIDGIAVELINMAGAYRMLGENDNASKCVNEIIDAPGHIFTPLRLSEASFVKARLYMDSGDYDAAALWAEKALTFCKNTACPAEGKIYNVKARAALYRKDPASAVELAAEGLRLNSSQKNIEEAGNSLRTMAEAKTMRGEYEEARKLFEDALAIDRSLGSARKVLNDLAGIGNTYYGQGRCDSAIEYFNRALSAGEASDDKDGTEKVQKMIGKCRTAPKKN